jgi:dsRNA-specific ribonuclease
LHWGEEDYQVWHKVWVMNSFDEEDEQTAAQTAGPQDGVDDLHPTAADGSGGAGGGDAVAKLYAPKALADIVESLVGAVLVDSSRSSSRGERFNWAAAWQVVQRLLPPLRT